VLERRQLPMQDTQLNINIHPVRCAYHLLPYSRHCSRIQRVTRTDGGLDVFAQKLHPEIIKMWFATIANEPWDRRMTL
jgi:hypothetical protein